MSKPGSAATRASSPTVRATLIGTTTPVPSAPARTRATRLSSTPRIARVSTHVRDLDLLEVRPPDRLLASVTQPAIDDFVADFEFDGLGRPGPA